MAPTCGSRSRSRPIGWPGGRSTPPSATTCPARLRRPDPAIGSSRAPRLDAPRRPDAPDREVCPATIRCCDRVPARPLGQRLRDWMVWFGVGAPRRRCPVGGRGRRRRLLVAARTADAGRVVVASGHALHRSTDRRRRCRRPQPGSSVAVDSSLDHHRRPAHRGPRRRARGWRRVCTRCRPGPEWSMPSQAAGGADAAAQPDAINLAQPLQRRRPGVRAGRRRRVGRAGRRHVGGRYRRGARAPSGTRRARSI